MITWIIGADKNINLVIQGKSYSVPLTHPNYTKIKDGLKSQDEELLKTLVDIPKHLSNISWGNVEVKSGVVYYKGKPSDNYIAEKILKFYEEGFPIENLLKFYDELMENPSRHCIQELYKFLEYNGIPITPSGTFLAYKRVRPDHTDAYSGTILNEIGKTFEMPRQEVDDDYRVTCSAYGIHAGSLDGYVRNYANNPGWPIMVVEINPRDVVACAYGEEKLRTCKYTPVGFLDKIESLPNDYHDHRNNPNVVGQIQDDDDDYDEDEEEDEDEI